MFRHGLKTAIWLVALATAAVGQPAPSSRVGGWLGAAQDVWHYWQGNMVLGQVWGSRASEDGIRLLETFEVNRGGRGQTYEANGRFNVVAPLGGIGSLRLGLQPWSGWLLHVLHGGSGSVSIEPSAGLTLNADDWDFMVAPEEMTYRGPGLKLNVSYGIWDLLDPPSKLNHSVRLDASAPWTLRFGGTRLEAGPSIKLTTYDYSTMDHSESRSLGGQVLLAGGSRLVDIFVAPEYYTANGLGYEVLAAASYSTYRASDTLSETSDNARLGVQARLAAQVWKGVNIEPGFTASMWKPAWWSDWVNSIDLLPRVALSRLWVLGSGCVLAAQVGVALPVGFHRFPPFVYNEEVALDARVGVCSVSRTAGD